MRRQLPTAIAMLLTMTVVTGIAYPLAVTGVAHFAFGARADGSLVMRNGHAIGSSIIGQSFADAQGNPDPRYFQPRPSAAGAHGYDPMRTGGTNLGPTNPDLLTSIDRRVAAYRAFNGLGPDAQVPVDAVTSSASGLDPDISPANALDQAPRVAGARGLDVAYVVALVDEYTRARAWGFLGENTVNVLALNLALDWHAPSEITRIR